mmetsp:Transcript_25745/g.49313  ORF Transcript_25745/g.49313 Transcript_25745/m.49313 type:complete len:255 (+) Transcript_25745:149-913(+)
MHNFSPGRHALHRGVAATSVKPKTSKIKLYAHASEALIRCSLCILNAAGCCQHATNWPPAAGCRLLIAAVCQSLADEIQNKHAECATKHPKTAHLFRELWAQVGVIQNSPFLQWFQVEHALQGPNLISFGTNVFVILHGVIKRTEQLVDDMLCELVYSLSLLFMQALQAPRHFLRFGTTNILCLGLQCRKVRYCTLRCLPDLELVNLCIDEALSLQHFRLPLVSICLHDLLEVVHIIRVHLFNISTIFGDIKRY